MSVYVDTLLVHHNAWGCFKKGSCHLTADTQDELHSFAALIGLKREWFQPGGKRGFWHYDLTASKRAKAVKLGAIEMTCAEWYELSLKRRKEALVCASI